MRAGTDTPFWTGVNLTKVQANFDRNREKTVHVRSFDPNPWGLFEVHGNVWEWVWDRYGAYPPQAVIDPVGSQIGPIRVLRGGSWIYDARGCRSAYRNRRAPSLRGNSLGFRLVKTD